MVSSIPFQTGALNWEPPRKYVLGSSAVPLVLRPKLRWPLSAPPLCSPRPEAPSSGFLGEHIQNRDGTVCHTSL